jgi:translation initiation factor 4B
MGGRRKLELAPRGSTTSPSADSTPPTPSTKPSPFGNAAPVNTAERERQVEERLAQRTASTSSVRDPPSRNVSQSGSPRAPLQRTTSSSAAKVDPFGNAKPIDTTAQEKAAEDRIAASRATGPTGPRERQSSTTSSAPRDRQTSTGGGAAPAVTSPTSEHPPASPTVSATSSGPAKPSLSPAQGLRKEGFSYSKMASGAKSPTGAAPISNGSGEAKGEGEAAVAAPVEEMAKASVTEE